MQTLPGHRGWGGRGVQGIWGAASKGGKKERGGGQVREASLPLSLSLPPSSLTIGEFILLFYLIPVILQSLANCWHIDAQKKFNSLTEQTPFFLSERLLGMKIISS